MIVGFPGETERQFEETARVCERSAFSKIHVFPYSPRSGTRAARLAGRRACPPSKSAASTPSSSFPTAWASQFAQSFLDETVEVLVESRQRASGLLTGLTDNYLRVQFDGPDAWRGELIRVRRDERRHPRRRGRACGDRRLVRRYRSLV